MKYLTPGCVVRSVQWCPDVNGPLYTAPVRRIALPRSRTVAAVVVAPLMPRDVMQQVCVQIGAHPALSWLVSHSLEVGT